MYILDDDGNDTLTINAKDKNIRLFFNVDRKYGIREDVNGQTSLYIADKSSINAKYLHSFVSEPVYVYYNKGIEIGKYFNEGVTNTSNIRFKTGAGCIETICNSKGQEINTKAWINEIVGQVAGWLSDKEYVSTYDALDRGTQSEIKELVAIYNNYDASQYIA